MTVTNFEKIMQKQCKLVIGKTHMWGRDAETGCVRLEALEL